MSGEKNVKIENIKNKMIKRIFVLNKDNKLMEMILMSEIK
jgi:hypothetical protein